MIRTVSRFAVALLTWFLFISEAEFTDGPPRPVLVWSPDRGFATLSYTDPRSIRVNIRTRQVASYGEKAACLAALDVWTVTLSRYGMAYCVEADTDKINEKDTNPK